MTHPLELPRLPPQCLLLLAVPPVPPLELCSHLLEALGSRQRAAGIETQGAHRLIAHILPADRGGCTSRLQATAGRQVLKAMLVLLLVSERP